MIKRSVKATLVLAAGIWLFAAGTAGAHHALTMVHEPPPAAIDGEALTLTVELASTCAPFCSAPEVTLRYLDSDGALREITRLGREHVPAAAVTFTIPGSDIGPAWAGYLTYWFDATQEQCAFAYNCHGVEASQPIQGAYSVPILPGSPADAPSAL